MRSMASSSSHVSGTCTVRGGGTGWEPATLEAARQEHNSYRALLVDLPRASSLE